MYAENKSREKVVRFFVSDVPNYCFGYRLIIVFNKNIAYRSRKCAMRIARAREYEANREN